MPRLPRLLLVLHQHTDFVRQLETVASAHRLELRRAPDWESLEHQIRAAPASALAVVDPYMGAGEPAQLSTELSALLSRFPSLTVAAAFSVGAGGVEQVRQLGAMGVVQVIDLAEEATAVAVGQRLKESRGRPLRRLIFRALPPGASGAARSILSVAASVVTEGGGGSDLARQLRITPRTLTRWCRRAMLPAPKRLLAWMRVLLAAELLDDSGRTISDVAISCGYSADSSLRHAFRTFLGMTPSALRAVGAFEVASGKFLQALHEARSEHASYRSRRRG